MKEIDLIQTVTDLIGLSYTASQWWVTVTTALVVATYFAARHIKPWFFLVIIVLYAATSASAIFEVALYGDLVQTYAKQLAEFRALGHEPRVRVEPGSYPTDINTILNCIVFMLGTASAATYSFVHWRSVRRTEFAAGRDPAGRP
jgi:hypothetical protein